MNRVGLVAGHCSATFETILARHEDTVYNLLPPLLPVLLPPLLPPLGGTVLLPALLPVLLPPLFPPLGGTVPAADGNMECGVLPDPLVALQQHADDEPPAPNDSDGHVLEPSIAVEPPQAMIMAANLLDSMEHQLMTRFNNHLW
jgi:hypothetical protein